MYTYHDYTHQIYVPNPRNCNLIKNVRAGNFVTFQGRPQHTMVLVLHVAFKAVAFAVYEFGGLAAGMGYVATFIAVTMLLR